MSLGVLTLGTVAVTMPKHDRPPSALPYRPALSPFPAIRAQARFSLSQHLKSTLPCLLSLAFCVLKHSFENPSCTVQSSSRFHVFCSLIFLEALTNCPLTCFIDLLVTLTPRFSCGRLSWRKCWNGC